ncbi:MAG TPA: AAA family ATPase [Paracoccus sp. (in: a-proteobacteria)]|uniref:ATP-dependent nuclease n=1 Tax=Paracoccus sp. TaxID=267 RepID=UPI002CE73B8F|nr:AAA family ATPase [Paracoccus sp. (in: a-proteobacteria)]HWL56435.1 AAA family ATPase [Paracoccus sp. (in: a-proteobacteria)]
MISKISIRNFRSIASADIDGNWITTLVGANDAGKSNVLRALNLFFNNEINSGEDFEFTRDYNQFAPVRNRKAPQIEISITFDLPDGYKREGQSDQVVWKKVWRKYGEVRDLEKRTLSDGQPFPQRSKIPALLDRIRFTHIPAIKDKAFFADLQGRLYDVLASVAEGPLKDSAGEFQTQLGAQLQDLLLNLRAAFGAEATMRLPENLREIFESLEISSDEVPLSRRGDGIKIRHIPLMLKFIAQKQDDLFTRGGVRYTHIWGFEEPENNVEMSAAFAMGDEFLELIAESDRFQLFLTTHSPIFYRLDQRRPEAVDWLTSHFVSKSGSQTIATTRAPDEVDESMGLMPIVAPYVAEAKKRYDEIGAQLEAVQDIAEQRRPTIFVEGDSDRVVLAKAWQLFSGIADDRVYICAGGEAYGGASALYSRSLAWMLTVRHRPVADRVKAASVFDNDASGNAARVSLGNDVTRMNLGNCGLKSFKLDTPPRLQPLARRGFNVSVDLESYYTDAVWERAIEDGWLEPIDDLAGLLSPNLLNQIAAGGANPFAELNQSDAARICNKFNDQGKRRASMFIQRLTQLEAERELESFRPMIDKLRGHLFQGGAAAE